jgi:hypothetical protein
MTRLETARAAVLECEKRRLRIIASRRGAPPWKRHAGRRSSPRAAVAAARIELAAAEREGVA